MKWVPKFRHHSPPIVEVAAVISSPSFLVPDSVTRIVSDITMLPLILHATSEALNNIHIVIPLSNSDLVPSSSNIIS